MSTRLVLEQLRDKVVEIDVGDETGRESTESLEILKGRFIDMIEDAMVLHAAANGE
jgi:hypothetical protein